MSKDDKRQTHPTPRPERRAGAVDGRQGRSFRPVTLSARSSNPARRGYDEQEVRAFLQAVSAHVRRLDQELSDHRLRVLEMGGRLKLADALREDALARAGTAEVGRRHVEVLLAQLGAGRADGPERRAIRRPGPARTE